MVQLKITFRRSRSGGGPRPVTCWIAGSNLAVDMDARLVFVVCCVGSGLCYELRSLSECVCVCVCVCLIGGDLKI